MRHALFVSFQYPPDSSSSGVLRTLKYTRYLADHGWRVTVLSPLATVYETLDEASAGDIPASVKVVRTRYLDTRRHLSVKGRYLALAALPDRFIGWLPWALAAGARIAHADPVELIYSTSPPATAHLVAWCLARRLGKPWVADFRDPWFEETPEAGAPAGKLFRTLDRRLEGRVVRDCDHVVTTTRQLRDALATRYASVQAERFSVIPNGYDEADFAALPLGEPRQTGRLCLVHAGSINPHFRDPVPLFKAIRRAADQGRLEPEHLQLRFLGGGAYAESAELHKAAADHGLAGRIDTVSRLPYADALLELARADVLLLLQASEDTRALIPAKLYEYLRMEKPVLALTLVGEASALLEQTGGGFAIDPADTEQLAAVLGELYQRWKHGTLASCHANRVAVQRYERRTLAAELAALFGRIAADAPAQLRARAGRP